MLQEYLQLRHDLIKLALAELARQCNNHVEVVGTGGFDIVRDKMLKAAQNNVE